MLRFLINLLAQSWVTPVSILIWTLARVKWPHQRTRESRNNMMLWWSERIVVSCLTVSCVSPTDPQCLGRWMRREEEELSQALSLLRQHWPAKRGQDAFRAWSPLFPLLCSIQQEQGRGWTPLLSFSPPVWDCGWGDGAATGCWGFWGGGRWRLSLSYYWQALVNQKQPGVTSHYTLPSSCLCVHPSFPCHILRCLHTRFSLFSLSFSSPPPLQGSPPFVCLCCASLVLEIHRYLYVHYLPATRYLNCHLSLLSRL